MPDADLVPAAPPCAPTMDPAALQAAAASPAATAVHTSLRRPEIAARTPTSRIRPSRREPPRFTPASPSCRTRAMRHPVFVTKAIKVHGRPPGREPMSGSDGRQAPARLGARPRVWVPAAGSRDSLVDVALDGVGVPDPGLVGIETGVAAGPALVQEVPAHVELDLQELHAVVLAGGQPRLLRGPFEQLMLLVGQIVDAVDDVLVVHLRPPRGCVLRLIMTNPARVRRPAHPFAEPVPDLAALLREGQRLHAPVPGRRLPFHQAPRFQPVHQSRDGGGVAVQGHGQLAHGHWRVEIELLEGPGLGRGQVELTRGGQEVLAHHPGQPEHELPGVVGGRGRTPRWAHARRFYQEHFVARKVDTPKYPSVACRCLTETGTEGRKVRTAWPNPNSPSWSRGSGRGSVTSWPSTASTSSFPRGPSSASSARTAPGRPPPSASSPPCSSPTRGGRPSPATTSFGTPSSCGPRSAWRGSSPPWTRRSPAGRTSSWWAGCTTCPRTRSASGPATSWSGSSWPTPRTGW